MLLMKSRFRRRAAVIGVLCALMAFAGCGESKTPSATAGGKDAVVVRTMKTTANLTQLPFLDAVERGYFADAGIDLKEQPDAATATAPIQALLAGQADIALTSANVVISAIEAGQDVTAVGIFSPATGFQLVLSTHALQKLSAAGVRPDSPLSARIAALKGLTIATGGPGSNGDTLLRATLEMTGVSPDKDVTIRTVPDPAAMQAALRQGQLDGFMFTPPVSQEPVVDDTGAVWVNFLAGDVPEFAGMPTGIVVTTKRYVASHREAVTGFLRAMQRGYQDIDTDPDDVAATLAHATYFRQTAPDLFKKSFQAVLPIFANSSTPTEAGFQRMLGLYNSDGTIKQKSTLTFEQFFTTGLH